MLRSFCVLALSAAPAVAADKPTVLRWYGQSCFQIESAAGKKVVIDPHNIVAFGLEKPAADVLLVTHEHDDHNMESVLPKNDKRVVLRGTKPLDKMKTKFEWEKIDQTVDGIKVKSFGNYHDEEDGKKRGKNSAFTVVVDGITFCHLGDLGHELNANQVKALGTVDVLMVPVGGIYTINGAAARKVTDAVKPTLYVVPMHCGVEGYDDLLPAREFLEDFKDFKNLSATNELAIPAGTKGDGKSYTPVVLGYKKAEK